MAKTHFKKLMNPNYLGAYSLDDGEDIILTIRNVKKEDVIGADGKKEECMVCYWKESNTLPMIVNATNAKTIAKLLKTPYIEEWTGQKIQIGTERVKAFGEVVEALRVRKTLPEPPIQCDACQSDITASSGMTTSQMSAYTKKRYGKKLCAKCAMQAKQEQDKPKPTEPKQADAKLPIAKPTEKDNGNEQSQTERRSESDGATQ